MTFVSYAQNFEDVLLWRALRDIEGGFWVDVGAAHPDTDSVTRAFHARGWRGINIEPVAGFHRLLAASRPDDINLAVVAGAADGIADFHVVEGTGLSSLAPPPPGIASHRIQVKMRTLAGICREHVMPGAAIHFLKIDAEGSEAAVLAGADFAGFRPWIVLVEATAPNRTIETHAAWEPILTAAEYRFVWFDGLNRFYLAAERHAALARHFRTPPNVWDDFLRAGDSDLARRIAAAETAAAERLRAIEAAERRATEARRAAEARAGEAAGLRATLAQQTARLAEAADRETMLRQAHAHAAEWLAAMRASTSWRLTAPLRRAMTMLGRGSVAGGQWSVVKQSKPEPIELPPLPPIAASSTTGHRPLTTVHQFHSGSAVGDAITNAMLLTRERLRALGFASDIFVEHPDPALAAELRPMAALPLHPGYVLIVRHSMGYDAFARIAALPAPKVLLYHNVTPPELLPEAGPLRHYARLGRAQLAGWRGRVAAALADSDYNAIELRSLGFDPVGTCTLLFDVARLRDAAAAHPRRPIAGETPFTLLFVGRVTAAKGQRELLAAYQLFRTRFARPARLVLVGRQDDAAYVGELRATIEAAGLAREVVLAGLVSDAALHDWYAAADLYVSFSAHEGFGVPLVEAMAHGVPVLAWPSGAVPYTLDGAAALLPARAPDAAAAAILALAADAPRRAAIVARQHAALDRFAVGRQMPVLLTALARAGAMPPPAPALRARLEANLHFTVTGHVAGSYSLATINRTLAAVLEAAHPGRVRLLPVAGETVADPLAHRPPAESGPRIVISQHYPVLVPDDPGDAAFALFYWEESLIPAATVAVLNRGFRSVLAPSAFVAKALLDSGVALPVSVVGHAPDLAAFTRQPREGQPRAEHAAFGFLHVSSCFPRKGVDVLLAAYARAFRRGDKVRLVIKGFPNKHNDVAEQIARLQAADPEAPDITLIDRDLDPAALAALYAEADALVLPTRGEGFNLPAAEAMAAGLPLIVTGHGGHMDFCDAGAARLLDFRLAPSGSHLASAGSLWAEPDAADLARALREAVTPEGRAAAAARVPAARRRAAGIADGEAVAARITAAALDGVLTPPPRPLRLGVVSSWEVRCGVAAYSHHLLDALPAEDFAGVQVFADRRGKAAEADGTAPAVLPCWTLGAPDGMAGAIAAIEAADPDIVLVQHQPGLFGWDALTALLAAPALARRAVVAATLHNTGHLEELAPDAQARTAAALAGIDRVLVHTVADVERLRGLGLAANVTLLPHGAPPPRPAAPPRMLPENAAPLIGCYGFFLPGKGIPQLIAALAILRARWPGARLRLVNAAYGGPESEAEIAACRAQAATAGLTGAIEWQTGFLPHDRSLELLGECDAVALPYQVSKEASSAALRTALAALVPVLVTPLPLFDEAGEAVMRAAGTDPAAIAEGLATLLADKARRAALVGKAEKWLADHAWAALATRLGGMLRGLHATRSQTGDNSLKQR